MARSSCCGRLLLAVGPKGVRKTLFRRQGAVTKRRQLKKFRALPLL